MRKSRRRVEDKSIEMQVLKMPVQKITVYICGKFNAAVACRGSS
jgi:hypothetical protein